MAVVPGWPRKAAGFPSIWLDRMKAYVDSRPGAPAAPGAPVELALAAGVTAFGDNPPAAVKNGDGTVSLQGGGVVRGPSPATAVNMLTVVAPYLPARISEFPVAAILISGGPSPAAASVTITTGGNLSVMIPALATESDLIEVVLDGITYWPADT